LKERGPDFIRGRNLGGEGEYRAPLAGEGFRAKCERLGGVFVLIKRLEKCDEEPGQSFWGACFLIHREDKLRTMESKIEKGTHLGGT